VVPGESATIDLFYPLPAQLQRAEGIPRVDVAWRVERHGGPVTGRTRFDAVPIEPAPPADRVASSEWWGLGWYDPLWPDYAFASAPFLTATYHERPFVRVAPQLPPPRAFAR
jgi:hypothetical protein